MWNGENGMVVANNDEINKNHDITENTLIFVQKKFICLKKESTLKERKKSQISIVVELK